MYESNILEDIKKVDTVYIAAHINPDGDAVGSTFSFALAVKSLGKKPVILLDDFDKRFNILKGKEFLYSGNYDELAPELFISLDCASKERLGNAESVFDKANTTYNIDHHISNTNYAQNNIVNGGASSACEVVYEVIQSFVDIDVNIASALYTGILTDTGGFTHNSTSERTHQIAGKLVSIGVDTPFIHSRILMEHTYTQVKVFEKALKNIVIDNGVCYTTLTLSEMAECGATTSDLDGIVSYILNINGVGVSLFATERENSLVKLSFRSRTIDVNEVAGLYGGGGHILAAGAGVVGKDINILVTEVVEQLKTRLKDYEKQSK